MPLKWEQGRKSPYACNYFAVLKVGPNTTKMQISETEKKILREFTGGDTVRCACGHEVDQHEVARAGKQLLEAGSMAEELLLVHPQPDANKREKVKALGDKLRAATTLPISRDPLPLRSPAAILWFVPLPSADAIDLPEWGELGLVQSGDPQDLALDIVFDS